MKIISVLCTTKYSVWFLCSIITTFLSILILQSIFERNFVYTFKNNDSQAIFTVNLLSTKCQTCPLFYLHYSFSHRLTGVYWHMVWWYKPVFDGKKLSKNQISNFSNNGFFTLFNQNLNCVRRICNNLNIHSLKTWTFSECINTSFI